MRFVSRQARHLCRTGSSPVRGLNTGKYERLSVPFWIAVVSTGLSQPYTIDDYIWLSFTTATEQSSDVTVSEYEGRKREIFGVTQGSR